MVDHELNVIKKTGCIHFRHRNVYSLFFYVFIYLRTCKSQLSTVRDESLSMTTRIIRPEQVLLDLGYDDP